MQIAIIKTRNMKKQGNVTLLKINSSIIMDTNNSEVVKSQRIQKNDYKNDQ
jgi:hypothetical protein